MLNIFFKLGETLGKQKINKSSKNSVNTFKIEVNNIEQTEETFSI